MTTELRETDHTFDDFGDAEPSARAGVAAIVVHGCRIDPITGEVLDLVERPEFHITDADSFAWWQNKIAEAKGRIAAAEIRQAHANEFNSSEIRSAARLVAFFEHRWGHEAAAYLETDKMPEVKPAPERPDVATASALALMRHLHDLDLQIIAAKAAVDSRVAEFTARIGPVTTRLAELRAARAEAEAEATPILKAHTVAMLKDKDERTLTTAFGSLSLRTIPGGAITVLDEEKAVAWLSRRCKAAIKITKSVLKTPLKGMLAKLPPDIFEVSVDTTKFEISTGLATGAESAKKSAAPRAKSEVQ